MNVQVDIKVLSVDANFLDSRTVRQAIVLKSLLK